MLSRRDLLSTAAGATLVPVVPSKAQTLTETVVAWYGEAEYEHDYRHLKYGREVWMSVLDDHAGALIFDLPEGVLVVEHPDRNPTELGRVFYAPAGMEIKRQEEVQVPRAFLQAALAHQAAQQQLQMFEEHLWGIPT